MIRTDKKNKGFTLLEVMVAVTIIVILFAVVIGGWTNISKRLKQYKLDRNAQIIYMTAQENLAQLFANGNIDKVQFSTKNPDSVSLTDADYSTLLLLSKDNNDQNIPSDWDPDTIFDTLTVITSDSVLADLVVPKSEYDEGGSWIIEYDQTTGKVYSAMYSEDLSNNRYYNVKDSNIMEVVNRYLRTDIKGRMNYGATVGYYGGDVSISSISAVSDLTCTVTVNNSETLSANVRVEVPYLYSRYDVTVSVTITGETSGTKIELPNIVLTYFQSGSIERNYSFTIDSLTSHMADNEQFKGLIPGENITIEAVASSASGYVDNAKSVATTNTLFESYTSSGSTGTVKVSTGRHLQNLDITTSKLNYTAIHTTNVIQTQDILLGEGSYYQEYYASRKFTPITNHKIASYDGSNYRIADLITTQEDASGLFGVYSGSEIKNVKLEGAQVKGIFYAGGLVGRASLPLAITNSSVYLGADDFAGYVASFDTSDPSTYKYWITASRATGGLVGYSAASVTVDTSCAASVLSSQGYTGGLVGDSVNSKVEIIDSYADSYLTGTYVGGLVGHCSTASTISGSYSAGFVLGQSTMAAGFTPSVIRSITGSYTIVEYGLGSCQSILSTANQGTSVSNVLYTTSDPLAVDISGTTHITQTSLKNLSSSVAALGNMSFSTNSNSSKSYIYNLIKGFGLDYYPYPSITSLNHYGDFDDSEFTPGTLVYYEAYTDGSYGFYGANKNILNDRVDISYDGYALLFEGNGINSVTEDFMMQFSISGSSAANIEQYDFNMARKTVYDGTTTKNVSSRTFSYIGKSYVLVLLDNKVVNTTKLNPDYYFRCDVTVGTNINTYYFNPHFARTVVQAESMPTSILNSTVYIRTARHFNNLSKFNATYREKTISSTFIQQKDIDFNDYSWSSVGLTQPASQAPIGDSARDGFAASYNGGYHKVTGFSIVSSTSRADSSNYIGLFGYINETASVSNLYFVFDYGENITSGSEKYSLKSGSYTSGDGKRAFYGMFAGANEGKITNCAVSGLTINVYAYNYSTTYIGGFVGTSSGVIKSSSASIPQIKVETNNSNAYVGGFIGTNSGSITASYGISAVDVTRFDTAIVMASGFAGRNDGTISRSYCQTSMITSNIEEENVAGFAPLGGACGNCYYLDGGSYKYVDNVSYYASNPFAGTAKKLSALEDQTITGFGKVANDSQTNCHSMTEQNVYPYPASVKDANGYVHFGDWVTADLSMGNTGFFYWELEEYGTNNGYHFYIVTEDGTVLDTLCTAHNDGGIITDYGYGYYEVNPERSEDAKSVTASWTNISTGAQIEKLSDQSDVKSQMEAQFDNSYIIHAYSTADAYSNAVGSNKMYLNIASGYGSNAAVTLSYDGATKTFYFSPFFAASISDSASMLGTIQAASYQVRSDKQLQYINWNNYKKNATTSIGYDVFNKKGSMLSYAEATVATAISYPYLGYAYNVSGTTTSNHHSANIYFTQTHDINANMDPNAAQRFTPIGSIYDSNYESQSGSEASNITYAYAEYFNGYYNGQSYQIKNLEISSESSSVGLFGVTIGASVNNLILYSDNGNTISTVSTGKGWYNLGGVVGMAANGGTTITKMPNSGFSGCAIAGYIIQDNRGYSGYGGANVGGFVGLTNVNFSSCSAVTDIKINAIYSDNRRNIRIGGMVGTFRGPQLSDCYSGGSITIVDRTKNSGTLINAGGIVGGWFMRTAGNLSTLFGGLTGNTMIKNCYSYIDSSDLYSKNPNSVCPVVSNGNNEGSGSNQVQVSNCYYYKGANSYKNYAIDSSYEVTLAKLSGQENLTSGTYYGQSIYNALNAGRTGDNIVWKPVTVTENNEAIDGKYSFPGNDKELEGLNYPLPTIITQTSTLGDTVNVHYGAWPKATGIYSSELFIQLDLIDLDETSSDVVITLYDNSNKANMTQAPSVIYGNNMDADSSDIVDVTMAMTDGVCTATISAAKAGAEAVTFTYTYNGVSYTTTVHILVTAIININIEPVIVYDEDGNEALMFQDSTNDSREYILSAYDKAGNDITSRIAFSSRDWSISSSSEDGSMTLTSGGWVITASDESIFRFTESPISRNDDGHIVVKIEPGNRSYGLADLLVQVRGFVIRDNYTVDSSFYSTEVEILKAYEKYEVSFYMDNMLKYSKIYDEKNNIVTPYDQIISSEEFDDLCVNRIFDCWVDERGEEFDFSQGVTADTNLYAKWEYVLVTLTDTLNNNQTRNIYAATKVYDSYSTYKFYYDRDLLDEITSNQISILIDNLYLFNGYTGFTDENGMILIDAMSVVLADTDLTFDANWIALRRLILHSSDSTQVFGIRGDGTINAFGTLTDPSRYAWNFEGWYADNGTSHTEVIGRHGSIVDTYKDANGKFIYPGTDDVELYAKWSKTSYVATDSMTGNNKYIIATGNSLGQVSVLRQLVSSSLDVRNIDALNNVVYVEEALDSSDQTVNIINYQIVGYEVSNYEDQAIVWRTVPNSDGYMLLNTHEEEYLTIRSVEDGTVLSTSDITGSIFRYSGHRLFLNYDSLAYYVNYDLNDLKFIISTTPTDLYLFVEQEVYRYDE